MRFKTAFSPREVTRSGDDSPAKSVWGYTLRLTGRAQIVAFALALLSTIVGLAPIELQRRMVDGAIAEKDGELLIFLALLYLGAVVAQQGAKFALRMMQSWMAESATFYTRRHLWRLHSGAEGASDRRDVVAILTQEVEALAKFAGGAPSQAFANASLLVGALGYMFWVSPGVAAAGLALLAPQVILTPLMQRRLNRLVSIRLRLKRRFTNAVSAETAPPDESEFDQKTSRLFGSRMIFDFWKFLMKTVLNLLNGLAPLGVIAVGGWMVIQGDATVGVVIAFVTGFSRLGDPIRQLISFYREAAEAEVRHSLIARWMKPVVEENGKRG